jgi:hypothetical protein
MSCPTCAKIRRALSAGHWKELLQRRRMAPRKTLPPPGPPFRNVPPEDRKP